MCLCRRSFAGFVAFLLAVVCTDSGATAQRTFVAGSGTDNPNCSVTAPCRTFAAAILATNTGGEIIVLESAGYGAVTVNKSVSIIAPPGIHAGISVFGGDGVVVDAPSANVVLRGLSINGQGGSEGVSVQQAARVRIENCVIAGMTSSGIAHIGDGTQVIVLDTIMRDNNDGIDMVSSNGSIVLDHVRIEHSGATGFFGTPGSSSISVSIVINDSVIAGSGEDGLLLQSDNSINDFQIDRSTIVHNGGRGILAGAGPGGSVRFTVRRSTIHDNGGEGFFALPGGGLIVGTLADNDIAANGGVGVRADQAGANLRMTGNVVGLQFSQPSVRCGPAGLIVSLQNNLIENLASTNNCFVSTLGQ